MYNQIQCLYKITLSSVLNYFLVNQKMGKLCMSNKHKPTSIGNSKQINTYSICILNNYLYINIIL